MEKAIDKLNTLVHNPENSDEVRNTAIEVRQEVMGVVDSLENICKQFVIMKYAFHGSCDLALKGIADEEIKKSLIMATKNKMLEAGIKMMQREDEKEVKELLKQILAGEIQ